MSELRMLAPTDFDSAARIFGDAYPGLGIITEEDRQRFKLRALELHQKEPTAHFHGLFRDGDLLGIMCLYDFRMNFRQSRIHAGGVGQVAVALTHKKEHVAKEMMLYSLRHYLEKGVPLVTLYPFRPDFYRKMGFGYGAKLNEYRLKPSAFPRGPSKGHIRPLAIDDRAALVDCYNRVLGRTHGLIEKADRELQRLFANEQNRLVGFERDGRIEGYMVFTWEQGEHFILNDIRIQEFIYESRDALSELLTFLHTQADQVRHVFVGTQDEYLHHLLLDPRNDTERLIPDVYHETNTQGVGLMYRVIDVPGMFQCLTETDFGGQSCTLKLNITDSLLPENNDSTLLRLESGRSQVASAGACDAEVSLDIADFSSLIAGTATFRALHRYGLAEITEPALIDTVDRAFSVREKPICTTPF